MTESEYVNTRPLSLDERMSGVTGDTQILSANCGWIKVSKYNPKTHGMIAQFDVISDKAVFVRPYIATFNYSGEMFRLKSESKCYTTYLNDFKYTLHPKTRLLTYSINADGVKTKTNCVQIHVVDDAIRYRKGSSSHLGSPSFRLLGQGMLTIGRKLNLVRHEFTDMDKLRILYLYYGDFDTKIVYNPTRGTYGVRFKVVETCNSTKNRLGRLEELCKSTGIQYTVSTPTSIDRYMWIASPEIIDRELTWLKLDTVGDSWVKSMLLYIKECGLSNQYISRYSISTLDRAVTEDKLNALLWSHGYQQYSMRSGLGVSENIFKYQLSATDLRPTKHFSSYRLRISKRKRTDVKLYAIDVPSGYLPIRTKGCSVLLIGDSSIV